MGADSHATPVARLTSLYKGIRPRAAREAGQGRFAGPSGDTSMQSLLALLIMFALPLFVPIVPIPGLPGLLAGLLGGYVAGRPGKAMQLALLPFVLLSVLIVAISLGVGLPLVGGLIAGLALLWLVLEHVTLVIGAGIGGLLAARSERARRATAPLPAPPAAAYPLGRE